MAQDDILSTKGCKRDPYSETEYNSHHTYYSEWLVGWVRNASTDSIQFHNSQGIVQQTISKGQPANPYTEYEYSYKLNQEENWPGGWVINSNMAIRHIDAFNQSGDLIALGKQQNPYYYVEFHNLYVTNDWHGGWVEYESGGRVYINAQGQESDDPEASGSGSGGGSGSGSGSGSGGAGGDCNVTPGFDYAGIIAKGIHYRLYVSWTSGTACTGGTSSITADVIGYYHNGILVDCSGSASCYWSGDYEATITYLGESILFHVGEFYYGT